MYFTNITATIFHLIFFSRYLQFLDITWYNWNPIKADTHKICKCLRFFLGPEDPILANLFPGKGSLIWTFSSWTWGLTLYDQDLCQRKNKIKNMHQCKILIVPEEGWFGQPKYSTPTKKSFYIVSTSASIFFILYVKPIWLLLIQRTPAGSSFRLFA